MSNPSIYGNNWVAEMFAIQFLGTDWLAIGCIKGYDWGAPISGIHYYSDWKVNGIYGHDLFDEELGVGQNHFYDVQNPDALMGGGTTFYAHIDNSLYEYKTFGLSWGYGPALGETSHSWCTMPGHFWGLQSLEPFNEFILYWADWGSLTYQTDSPYWLNVVSSTEFYIGGGGQ